MNFPLLLLLTAQAQTWPADDAWVPVPMGGAAIEDPAGDHGAAPSALDLVGDPTDPALQWTGGPAWLYLRLRVADDPLLGPDDLVDGVWELGLDLDGDDRIDGSIAIDGNDDTVSSWVIDPPSANLTLGGTAGGGGPLTGRVRVVGGGTWSIDLALPQGVGALPPIQDSFRAVLFTRANRTSAAADAAGCDGGCPTVADALTDAIAVDADLDDAILPWEYLAGTDPNDADSDDDGVRDGDELPDDSDGDGATDGLDCDSDDDGLLDGTELGLFLAGLPADTDTSAGCWTGDADTTNPITDPTLRDTDGGGLPDGTEDFDHDGALGPWETDPTDPSDDTDTDGDGVADVLELLAGDGVVDDADSDGDGIGDAAEGLTDQDGDGTPGFTDPDSDGDGIDDVVETDRDSDGDSTPDYLDLDSDDDGSLDREETDADSDGDGTPDYLDLDSDDDGIPDAVEGRGDYDGDGIPDRTDTDSDNDGIPDEVEGTVDTDEGGSPNYLDSDSDNDGIGDAVEGTDDVDGDGLPNYIDTNSDGTGPSDWSEGIADGDCDGIPNYLDPDEEDGFCDPAQPEPGVTGTGTPDFRDETARPGAGQFTGGSCSTTPGSVGGWTVALGLLLVALRRRGPWLLALAPVTAGAQELDAQRFAPVVDRSPLVKVVDGRIEEGVTAGVWMNHADDPLVFRSATGEEIPLLGAVSTTDLVGSGSIGAVRIGAALPLHVARAGERIERSAVPGDVRLCGELRLFESEGLSAGLWGDGTWPTGARSTWLSAGTVAARGGAAISLERGQALFALNAGGRSGTGASLGELASHPGPIGGAGFAWAFSDELGASLEVDREDWLANPGEPGAHPMEWLGSVRATAEGAALHLGVGSGIGSGVGAPDFRAVAGLVVQFAPEDRSR